MGKPLKIMLFIALLSVTFLCPIAGFVVYKLCPVIDHLDNNLTASDLAITKVNTTLDIVNTNWLGKTGFLQTTLRAANYTIEMAGKTSKKEFDMLDVWNASITHTLTDVDVAVKDSSNTMKATTTSVAKVGPLLDEAKIAIQKSEVTLDTTNKLIADTNLPKIAAHVESMTDSGAHIASDVKDETHKLVHPDKVKLGFWGTMSGGMMWWHTHNPLPPMF